MVLLVLLCSAIYKLTKFVMRAGPFEDQLWKRGLVILSIETYDWNTWRNQQLALEGYESANYK